MTIPTTVAGALALQYSTDAGASWHTFGTATDLGALLRTRRISMAPGLSVTAQRWRVVKVGAADWTGAVASLEAIKFWSEAALAPEAVGQLRLWSFNYDDASQRYIMVATPGNLEVYRAGVRQASIAIPYTGVQVLYATRCQQLDTMISFHADVAPYRIMRQGAHNQWDGRALSFVKLPLYDYTGQHAGGVNEVQKLFFHNYVNLDTFNITLEGETTNAIVYSNVGATTAAHIQAALEALNSVGVGQVVVASVSANEFTVTFQGLDAASDLGEMAPETLSSTNGAANAATITQGEGGGEPVVSATRGWPSCGCFYQSRLYLGGLRSRPQTFLASRLGSYFNFDTKGGGANGALDETLDTEQVTAIKAIFPGSHLQIFTGSAEFYVPVEPHKPPAAVKQTTGRGIVAGTPQARIDNATLLVTSGGGALATYQFDFGLDTYVAPYLSVLASHLFTGDTAQEKAARAIVDLGFSKAQSTTEADRAFIIRKDGAGALMVALRDQDVTGFAPVATQGVWLAAAAEMGGEIYAAAARTVGGQIQRFLERFDREAMFDCQVSGGPGMTLAGLGHIEGVTAGLYIDGKDGGDAVVADGAVNLPFAALQEVTAGYLFSCVGRTMPGKLEQDPRAGASMGARVGEIAFRLGPTANLKAGIVGGKPWKVGRPDPEGWARIQGVPGFRSDAQVEFRQDRPGPLQILEIAATVTS